MSGASQASPSTTAPTYTDPVNGQTFDTAAALNNEINYRTADETWQSASDTANNTYRQQLNEDQFARDKATALQNTTSDVNQYFTNQGYDPNKYASQIATAINNAGNSVDDAATGNTTTQVKDYLPTITKSISPTLGAQILQSINSGVQSKATNAISNAFTPTYAQDNISNDWLTPAATSALDAQFNPLSSQLLNAQKRGTLNDTGYQAALTALGNAKTAASSTVNKLGTNILNNDRTNVDSYITGAKNDAAGLNAATADSFDPSKYITGASDLVNQDKGNFAGDLTNAIGSTAFSSLGDLLNAGGVVQGATDPTATNPSNTGTTGGGGISDAYIAQQALANQKRGLGSSGAF